MDSGRKAVDYISLIGPVDVTRGHLGHVTGARHAALVRLVRLTMDLFHASAADLSILTDPDSGAEGDGVGSGAGTVVSHRAGGESLHLEALGALALADGTPLVVTDAPTDHRVRDLGSVLAGDVGAYVGMPLRTDEGTMIGVLGVVDGRAREWSDDEMDILGQLAGLAVMAIEMSDLTDEYETNRDRWELAIEAAGIGSFDVDLRTGELAPDDRLISLFGHDPVTWTGSWADLNSQVDPEDAGQLLALRQQAVIQLGTYENEYRITLPTGERRWIQARGRVFADGSGQAARLIGTIFDNTGRRESEAQLGRVLDGMSAALLSVDGSMRLTYVNAEAERLLGTSRQELIGARMTDLFPAPFTEQLRTIARKVLDEAEATTVEAYLPEPLDSWCEMHVWPGADGVSFSFLDITARRAAQERAERTAARDALLGQVTSALGGTLDPVEAATRLARLMVPALAQWCVVSLVDDDHDGPLERRIRDVAWWHAEPGLRELTERYARLRSGALEEDSFLSRALQTGRYHAVADAATEVVGNVLRPDSDALALLVELAPEFALIMPLRAHDRNVGLLTMFRAADDGPFLGVDLETATEAAARAGIAFDNARHYADQRGMAESLQRSLLTEPPELDHAEIAVRYAPAAETAKVGGDWYDAFTQAGGATVLVIGDVVGHDSAAAAAMGQLRSLTRGIAVTTGDGPAQVLSRLDSAMQLLEVDTTATAAIVRLEPVADGPHAEERGTDGQPRGATRVRWSNAGHPPPMAIAADGGVTILDGGCTDPDLLLGVNAATMRHESEVLVAPGATVLLYTDGLVERRDQGFDEGVARLRDTLAMVAALSAGGPGAGEPGVGQLSVGELCDEVLARMLPEVHEDDVALVAIRLGPRDAE